MMPRGFAACLLACLALVPAQAQPTTPAELAQSLQRKYASIRDFSADFTHTYRGGVLKKQITEKGRLLIKKPGRMRWDYSTPEVKQFISDGVKVYSYIPADRQVIVGTVPKDDTASTPALFLTGKGDLTRDFTASEGDVPAGFAAGTRALKLVPRTRQPDYDWLVLLVEPGSLALRGMVSADSQGGTSMFSFANMKENVGLADSEFTFRIPRGVDVITDAGGR
ncbi:MAG: outer membrane lipoprotein carrier protein LolA [Vicinamibacterales bacterium]